MDIRNDAEPKGRIWLLIILALVVFAVSIRYFNKDNLQAISNDLKIKTVQSAASRQPRAYNVFYSAGVFSPTNIRVHAGDSISFQNGSLLPMRAIYADNSPANFRDFDSKENIPPNQFFSYVFLTPGTYNYRNFYNQSEIGAVIVRPSN